MAKISIFKAGETEDNIEHTFSGWRDIDLDSEGIKEAEKIGQELKNEKVTKAYQSDLTRSKHALKLVLDGFHSGVELITDPRIKERDYGNLTGKNKDEANKQDPNNYKLWNSSYEVKPPGGESMQDLEVRVLAFLKDTIPTWTKDDVIFISAHGNSIRPMRRYFEHLSVEEMCSYENIPGKIYNYQI